MPSAPKAGKKHRSNRRWIERHVTDPYVRAATQRGYRARSAYKLIEIDDKDRLLAPGHVVIDLGAAPGSWLQVVRERMVRQGRVQGRIIGLDLLPITPIPDVTFLQGDFRDAEVVERLESELAGAKADLILSDMAPNLSGISVADAARGQHLLELALDFARSHLEPGGAVLLKAFHGSGYSQFVAELKRSFRQVQVRKPPSSRAESAETFLLARGLKKY